MIQAVVAWSAEAAREGYELAVFRGEEPEEEGGMGLWQAFQARFPKVGSNYDMLLVLHNEVFRSTIRALKEAKS